MLKEIKQDRKNRYRELDGRMVTMSKEFQKARIEKTENQRDND